MSTETRRNVFISIVSAEDYIDAFQKIVKLGLRGEEERDIPFVVLYLCGREKQYNPYYEHLAVQLCSANRRLQFSFETSFWDIMTTFSDAEASSLSISETRKLTNQAKLLAALIGENLLGLLMLKKLYSVEMNTSGHLFLRVFFETLLTERSESDVKRAFARLAVSHGAAAGAKQRTEEGDKAVIMAKQVISLFLSQAFDGIKPNKTDTAEEHEWKKTLRERVKMASKMLEESISSDMF